MSGIARLMQMGAAGTGNHPAPLPIGIEDYFSTYLYTGNGSTQTITNGIDLAGEGGLVWIKARTSNPVVNNHVLVDSERGEVFLSSDTTSANTPITGFTFNSDGFNLPNNVRVSSSGVNNASWTFRKAPRFFDVVTWSGTGNQTIQHSLGVEPGCIIVKRVGASEDWWVFHRSVATDLKLNLTSAALGFSVISSVTSTTFNVSLNTTSSPDGYVAYLFAHDPLGPSGDGSDGLIACGSVSGFGTTVNIGWEPQWLLIKRSDGTGDWILADNMRGIATGGNDALLYANTSGAETSANDWVDLTSTGFVNNIGSGTYIYIAIRRGPMRAPESGTEVFAIDTRTTGNPSYSSGFPVDMGWKRNVDASFSQQVAARLTGTGFLVTSSTNAESSDSGFVWDYMDGWAEDGLTNSSFYSWMFRRAPEFFDVVAYTGDGTGTSGSGNDGQTLAHNLSAQPELIITKCRSANSTFAWLTGCKYGVTSQDLRLNSTAGSGGIGVNAFPTTWNTNTATSFVVRQAGLGAGVNASGQTYIAYLFASKAGVSKVGSYTGNGSSQTIDCGFTTGARFVLIKRTDSTGDWYVWDTARGIVSANDPHLSLNTTAAEVTTDDSVDPDATGFIVNQVAATNINVNAANYIYLAIA